MCPEICFKATDQQFHCVCVHLSAQQIFIAFLTYARHCARSPVYNEETRQIHSPLWFREIESAVMQRNSPRQFGEFGGRGPSWVNFSPFCCSCRPAVARSPPSLPDSPAQRPVESRLPVVRTYGSLLMERHSCLLCVDSAGSLQQAPHLAPASEFRNSLALQPGDWKRLSLPHHPLSDVPPESSARAPKSCLLILCLQNPKWWSRCS